MDDDYSIPGAFQAGAFTSAFQLARTYAGSKRRPRARGSRYGAYLVPLGSIYPDERYVIVRGKLGQGLATFEKHIEYDSEDQPEHSIKVNENWLNIATEPTFKVSSLDNDIKITVGQFELC